MKKEKDLFNIFIKKKGIEDHTDYLHYIELQLNCDEHEGIENGIFRYSVCFFKGVS